MLPFPEELPTIDQIFLKTEDQYYLTKVAKDVWGPLFAEAGLDLKSATSPERFKAMGREVVCWRRAQHLSAARRQESGLPAEDPRRKMTEALETGTFEDFQAASRADDTRQQVVDRRATFCTV